MSEFDPHYEPDYALQEEQETWQNIARTAPTGVADYPVNTEPLATEKQVSYLIALRDGKDLTPLSPEQRAWLADADFAQIPKRRASDVIDQLKGLFWKPRENDQPQFAEMYNLGVKTGRYAVDNDEGVLAFYSVKRDEEKLACWVDVWASDTRYPIKGIPAKLAILKKIAADPDAGPRFGREIGKCYVCGRTLTDDTSRALGIGPVCRGDQ